MDEILQPENRLSAVGCGPCKTSGAYVKQAADEDVEQELGGTVSNLLATVVRTGVRITLCSN